ncbi:MAG: amidohydrolase family protein, partial [Clostridia bacterium]|nr:amidohydrolase family protein [Clostridia bacterium]
EVYITNSQIVLENGILWDGVLSIDNGIISAFGRQEEIAIPDDSEIIDAKGTYVGPGLIDIHVHGGGGYDTYFNADKAAVFFLKHGTTSFLATPCYDLNLEDFVRSIRKIREDMKTTPSIKGMYMEGPYMNPKYGACAHLNPWKGPICENEYKALVDEAGEDAKIWAVAPEREGLMSFLEYARNVNPTVRFALGHSEAKPAEVRALGQYRPTLLTHFSDATGRVGEGVGIRKTGPEEYCLNEPDMYAELISDSCGVHAEAEMQQMVIRCKGVHRTVLITDALECDCEAPPQYAHITDIAFDDLGNINGSKLTMDQACRNIMRHTNCGIAQAFVMASLNPAKMIGLDHQIGSIEVGKVADLIFVDDKFNVQNVMQNGKICKIKSEEK